MAANPERQEVTLVADWDGVEKVYTLKLTTAASIALEERLNKTTLEIMETVSKSSIKTMRDLIHAMLQKHHGPEFPDSKAGLHRVSELIDACGGIGEVVPKMVKAIGLNADKDKSLAQDGPNPTEAQAGTGGGSTLTLAASA